MQAHLHSSTLALPRTSRLPLPPLKDGNNWAKKYDVTIRDLEHDSLIWSNLKKVITTIYLAWIFCRARLLVTFPPCERKSGSNPVASVRIDFCALKTSSMLTSVWWLPMLSANAFALLLVSRELCFFILISSAKAAFTFGDKFTLNRLCEGPCPIYTISFRQII